MYDVEQGKTKCSKCHNHEVSNQTGRKVHEKSQIFPRNDSSTTFVKENCSLKTRYSIYITS